MMNEKQQSTFRYSPNFFRCPSRARECEKKNKQIPSVVLIFNLDF